MANKIVALDEGFISRWVARWNCTHYPAKSNLSLAIVTQDEFSLRGTVPSLPPVRR